MSLLYFCPSRKSSCQHSSLVLAVGLALRAHQMLLTRRGHPGGQRSTVEVLTAGSNRCQAPMCAREEPGIPRSRDADGT